jgi:hypothetical protein
MNYTERRMHSALNRFYEKWERYLFPNTPLEVRVEEGRNRMLFYAVWNEGQWYHDCNTIPELEFIVKHVAKMDMLYWTSPVLRINPDWPDWPRVNIFNLNVLELELQECDDATMTSHG